MDSFTEEWYKLEWDFKGVFQTECIPGIRQICSYMDLRK